MRVFYFLAAFIVFATAATFLARGIYYPSNMTAEQPGEPGGFHSGPQPEVKVPGPFEPLNINGASAGKEECLYCRYGNAPTVMVFASRPSENLTSLIRNLDKAAATSGKPDDKIGACVIVTESNPETQAALTKIASQENLKHVILGMLDAREVKHYKLNPEAEATVLLYSKRVVRANHSYKPGELTLKTAEELGAEAGKFLANQ